MTFSRQLISDRIIIGIKGERGLITEEFESFFVRGAAGSPHFLSDNFLYFWTTRAKLIEALIGKFEAKFYSQTGIQLESKPARQRFRKKAEEVLESFSLEEILKPNQIIQNEYRVVGNVEERRMDV